ncbi:hypothetical protein D3C77_791230 [compost metagenome]
MTGIGQQRPFRVGHNIRAVKLHKVRLDMGKRFSRAAPANDQHIFVAVMLKLPGFGHTELFSS